MRKTNTVIMTLAGLLLIVAAILKFHEMLTECILSWTENKYGFWESYEFLLIQIPLEFALGVWMVSGLFRKAAWIAGTTAFFGFILVTIFKIVTGAESCGCFGQVDVDPKITLYAIDLPFFLLLAIFRPKGLKLLPPPWPNLFYMLAVAIIAIGPMAFAPSAMVAFRPDCKKADDTKPDQNAQLLLEMHKIKQELTKNRQETELLKTEAQSLRQRIEALQQDAAAAAAAEALRQQQQQQTPPQPQPQPMEQSTPEQQPEPQTEPQTSAVEIETTPPAVVSDNPPAAVEQWEWLQYVVEENLRSELSTGLDVILMYHHDCPTCAEMVPKYSEYCKQMAEQGNEEFRITFLAVPPIAETGPVPADTTCLTGKLTDQQKWQIMSPYVVALLDGQLVKTWKQGTAPEPENIIDEVFSDGSPQ